MTRIEKFIPRYTRIIADNTLKMSVLTVLLVVPTFCTVTGVNDPNTSLPEPEKIQKTLMRGTVEAKENLANDLKLRAKAENSTVCNQFEAIRISYPVLEPGSSYAVLILRSQVCWEDYVVVMRREASKRWHFVISYPVFSKYGHSRISFPSLLRQGQQEIMIDRDCLAAGTGFWQYNTAVIRFQDRRPDVIFDDIQELNFFVPERVTSKDEVGNTEETENGIFFIVPSDIPARSLSDILEKQIIARHKRRIVRWRLFSWDAETNRYRSQPVDEGTASDLLKKVGAVKH
jgi:hypothetical protein